MIRGLLHDKASAERLSGIGIFVLIAACSYFVGACQQFTYIVEREVTFTATPSCVGNAFARKILSKISEILRGAVNGMLNKCGHAFLGEERQRFVITVQYAVIAEVN